MNRTDNEDLFEGTKMSFGEHLEELRVCLVKSVLGLTIGFLIGMYFAGPVVEKIEKPLQRGLADYYFNKTKRKLESEYGTVPAELETFMQREQFVFQEVYWELDEVARILKLHQQLPGTTGAPPEATNANTNAKTDAGQLAVLGGEPGPPSTRMLKTRLWRPLDANVTSLSAHEPFMIWVKASLITGAVISSPYIFLQIWTFIAAGLYPHEKNYVHIFLPLSLGLFFSGAALAFFFVFDPVLHFLFTFNDMMNIDPDPRISEWMSFVLLMPLGFGVSFQLPLVMMLIERVGIISTATYLNKWRVAVLAIFVVSMVLTPADPISMLLMAVPLTGLYFGGILLCRYMPRRTSPYGQGYDPQ